jgi:hypothetical protein
LRAAPNDGGRPVLADDTIAELSGNISAVRLNTRRNYLCFNNRTITGLCKLQFGGVSALQVALGFFCRHKRVSVRFDFAVKFAGR